MTPQRRIRVQETDNSEYVHDATTPCRGPRRGGFEKERQQLGQLAVTIDDISLIYIHLIINHIALIL